MLGDKDAKTLAADLEATGVKLQIAGGSNYPTVTISTLKLYHLKNGNGRCYGDYESCVVLAYSEAEARLIHPSPEVLVVHPHWPADTQYWCKPEEVIVGFIANLSDCSRKSGLLETNRYGD